MSDPRSVLTELDDVLAAARRLPVCDGAAKLHALIARVLQTAQSGGNISSAVDALASAAAAALDDDPWVQFDKAVGRLQARPIAVSSSTRLDDDAAAVSAPAPA